MRFLVRMESRIFLHIHMAKKLTPEESFKESLVTKAELNKDQQEHFLEGMKGEEKKILDLSRESYMQLQKIFEEYMLEIGVVSVRPFAYNTKTPLTPLYNSDHLRHNVVQDVFGRNSSRERKSLGVSVVTEEGLELVFQKIVQLHGSIKNKIYTLLLDDEFGPVVSFHYGDQDAPYFSFEGSENVSPTAFMATQLTSEEAKKGGGRIIFGDEAKKMHDDTISLHEKNIEAGNGHFYAMIKMGIIMK